MAEILQRDRLQPSLLDRLTDDHPDDREEAPAGRALSLRQLRQAVLRDLQWLFNAGNLGSAADLEDYPQVARSVLNYGLPDLSGLTAAGLDAGRIEHSLRQAILDFEPRILRNSVRVRLSDAPDDGGQHALSFRIEGELWAQPSPLHLMLRTELDLENGAVQVSEQGR